MLISSLESISFFQKKQDVFLYKANKDSQKYILKAIITKDDAVRQAFSDEYHCLSVLSHPSIPHYYCYDDSCLLPGLEEPCLAICMADCGEENPPKPVELSLAGILQILCKTGHLLSYLLNHGILYTDLNPSNILLYGSCDKPEIYLVDYTYCYYFQHNPNPAYTLRFSYDLNPALKGQQILIQELSFLLQEYISMNPSLCIPSKVYTLMESGLHPTSSLSLEDFLSSLEQIVV